MFGVCRLEREKLGGGSRDFDSDSDSDAGSEEGIAHVSLKFYSRRQLAICAKVLADAPEPLLTLTYTQRQVMEQWIYDGEGTEEGIRSSEEREEYVRLSVEQKMVPKSLYMVLNLGIRKYGNPLLAKNVEEGRKILLRIYTPMKGLMRSIVNNGLLGP
ncbi:hypothetical protein KIPB_011269 [Kipferlia bialata]|uniref:Uncharacterized protein n=1 Tax=Kipferlia bialata TaxID=797122 RepID=A0A9K3GNM3_9EUKA|nr:hypothetical protein KIPB_011269 [Kipferlia bialata]|eukprot:g11269.t1